MRLDLVRTIIESQDYLFSTLPAVALYGKVTAYGNRFKEEDMDRRHFLQSSIALSTLAGAPGALSSQNWKEGRLRI